MNSKRIAPEREVSGSTEYMITRTTLYDRINSVQSMRLVYSIGLIVLGLVLVIRIDSPFAVFAGVFCAAIGAQMLLWASGVSSVFLGIDGAESSMGRKGTEDSVDLDTILSHVSDQLSEVEYSYSAYINGESINKGRGFLKEILPITLEKSPAMALIVMHSAIEQEFGFSAYSEEADSYRVHYGGNHVVYNIINAYKTIALTKERVVSGRFVLAQKDVVLLADIGNRLIKAAHIIRNNSYSEYRS